MPKTAEAAEAQVKRAYKAVNDSLPQVQPNGQRRPTKPVTGGQVAGNVRVPPANTRGVIDDVLARRAAR
jgi:hypothetical protein